MKLYRNTYVDGRRQNVREHRQDRVQYETFPSTDHQYQRFDVPHYQGHQAHQDPDINKPEKIQRFNSNGPQLDEWRIDGLIQGIRNGSFKYYVKGGYSRSRRTCLTPGQVARINNLPLGDCLFEVPDSRIEHEVELAKLMIVRASTYRTNPAPIQTWGN